MQLAPDLDTGPAQLGRGGVCEGCAAAPLALLQRREKQAARDTESVESGRSLDAGRRGWRPVAGWWAESSQEDSRVASNMKQRESAQRAQTQL